MVLPLLLTTMLPLLAVTQHIGVERDKVVEEESTVSDGQSPVISNILSRLLASIDKVTHHS